MKVWVVVRVTIKGIPSAPAMRRKASQMMDETCKDILVDIKGAGKTPAPIRFGHLRRSYTYRKDKELEYTVYNDVNIAHYAVYNEFGTHFMLARPHLKPTTLDNADNLIKKMRKIFK